MSGFTNPDRSTELALWGALGLLAVVMVQIVGCLP